MNFDDLALGPHSGISALDRSINYGDGCFTTMYCEHSSIFILDSHLLRLKEDTQRLGIDICIETVKLWLFKACEHVLEVESKAIAIKILVSRGTGGRGYEPPLTVTPQILIGFYPTAKLNLTNCEPNAHKYNVQIAKMQLSTQPLLAGIKHLNRLEQVLAKQELLSLECDDLLLCDQSGNLVEGTASNLFYIKDGIWISPNISKCGVNGVMRKSILEFMRHQEIEYEIKDTDVIDILDAESVFLCNAIKFIVPVSCLSTVARNINYDVSPSIRLLTSIYEWQCRHKVSLAKANS